MGFMESRCEFVSWMLFVELAARKPLGDAVPRTGTGAASTAVMMVDKNNFRFVILICSLLTIAFRSRIVLSMDMQEQDASLF